MTKRFIILLMLTLSSCMGNNQEPGRQSEKVRIDSNPHPEPSIQVAYIDPVDLGRTPCRSCGHALRPTHQISGLEPHCSLGVNGLQDHDTLRVFVIGMEPFCSVDLTTHDLHRQKEREIPLLGGVSLFLSWDYEKVDRKDTHVVVRGRYVKIS